MKKRSTIVKSFTCRLLTHRAKQVKKTPCIATLYDNFIQISSDTVGATARQEPKAVVLIPTEPEAEGCFVPHATT